MAKVLSPEGIASIRKAIDDACADNDKGLPGVSLIAVNKEGKEIFAHAAGKRGHGSDEPLTLESTFWFASCTKLIAAIACMQLVEQGKLALDDVEQVEKLCPELKEVKVLQEDGKLVPKKRGITLRMLLTHTAGFGYSFMQPRLRDYNGAVGFDEMSLDPFDFHQPLVNQPGEKWEYGINIDWAAILLERASGMTTEDYFQQHVLGPMGVKSISFFPSEDVKERLAYMNTRASDGQLSRAFHPWRRALTARSDEEKKAIFQSAGAGCFGSPQDYTKILAMLLNGGTSPTTGKQILTQATVDTMFTNQIPDQPDFARAGMAAAKPEYANPAPELYPIPGNEPQGWGLSFMITPSPTGRTRNSAQWAGLPNLFWWCDREKGVAALLSTQIIPFGDMNQIQLWVDVETKIFGALQ